MATVEELLAALNAEKAQETKVVAVTPGGLPRLNWQTVDLDTMPKNVKGEFDNWRKLQDATNTQREKLEKAATAYLEKEKLIPNGQVVRFSYNWGKMAIAFADPDVARGGKSKGKTFSFGSKQQASK